MKKLSEEILRDIEEIFEMDSYVEEHLDEYIDEREYELSQAEIDEIWSLFNEGKHPNCIGCKYVSCIGNAYARCNRCSRYVHTTDCYENRYEEGK